MADIAQIAAAVEEGRKIGLAQARSEFEAAQSPFKAPEAREVEYDVHFTYEGVERVVRNPQITRGAWTSSASGGYSGGYRPLLSGVEVFKDGETSDQFKHFRLDRITVT